MIFPIVHLETFFGRVKEADIDKSVDHRALDAPPSNNCLDFCF